MVVKTRSGSEIRLCNDCEVNYNITDGIHAICMTPMFAGQTSKFYSYAEHSCHIFDYITENLEEIFTELSKNNPEMSDTRKSIFDLSKKDIQLYSLISYMAHPFLFATIGNYTSFTRNRSHILSAFLRGIGHNYKVHGGEENNPCYYKAKGIIEYADKQITKEVIDENYYNKDARYMYYEPKDVVQMFISRFNQVAPFKLYLLNKSVATETLNYYLPKIKMA